VSQTALPWQEASLPLPRANIWQRAARLSPREGWLTVLLVLSTLLVVVWSVQRAHWVKEVPALGWVVLGAIALGLLAAKARGPAALLHLVSSLAGLLFVGWLMTGVVPGASWEEHLVELGSRVLAWFLAAFRGGISNDSVPFGFFLTVLAWAISYWTIWSVSRGGRAWLALGPSLIAILVNLSHFPGSTGVLFALYVGLALLLVVRINARQQQNAWERSQTDYGTGHALNLFHEAAWATALIVLLAWQLPLLQSVPVVRTAWRNLTSPWTNAETEFGRLFSSLRSAKNAPLHTFDSALPFRGQVNLGQNVVMTVAAEIPDYWRARSYDVYTSKGWLSSDLVTRPLEFSPEDPLAEEYLFQQPTTITFEPLQPSAVVFTAGHPLEVSVPVRAERAREFSYVLNLQASTGDRELPRDLQELAATLRRQQQGGPLSKQSIERNLPSDARLLDWTGEGARFAQLTVGRVEPHFGNVLAVRSAQRLKGAYNVTAAVPTAEADQLRRASAVYPGWVRDRYAGLPEQLPSRVRALAQEITRGQTNSYDKALAVQDYLRHLRYTFEIPAPPTDADTVDWFLFDMKAGYCDYYASSFAVLLRSLGIPTRLSVGYFTGQWEPALERYVVSEADAHSWPEVYFPQYGWIRFEPTPARPPVVRGDVAALLRAGAGGELAISGSDPFLDEFLLLEELLAAQGQGQLGRDLAAPGILPPFLWVVPLSVASLGLMVLLFLWRRGLGGLGQEARVYLQLTRLAGWAGMGPQVSQTPREFGASLAQRVPRAQREIELVVGEYAVATYGRRRGPAQRQALARAWSRLRWSLLWRATLGRLGRQGQ